MDEIFITSTGTEIGKSSASVLIAKYWMTVADSVGYWKPVASGCEDGEYGYRSPDEVMLIEQAGLPPDAVEAGYRFDVPRSPDVAAEIENRSIEFDRLVEEYRQLKKPVDRLIVEGIGGVAVPLVTGEHDVADLIGALEIPALLVVSSELGTVSYTRSAISHLEQREQDSSLAGIVLTPGSLKEIHEDNLRHLRRLFPKLPVNLLARYDTFDDPALLARMGQSIMEELDE